MTDQQECIDATIDTELMGLLARRGPHSSEQLVLGTVAVALPDDERVRCPLSGRLTGLGTDVLRRWDHLRKEWG
ncbi:MAG: hypothetical protein GY838_13080 [bacterium]|nr:hypothetical protein [bacterium]